MGSYSLAWERDWENPEREWEMGSRIFFFFFYRALGERKSLPYSRYSRPRETHWRPREGSLIAIYTFSAVAALDHGGREITFEGSLEALTRVKVTTCQRSFFSGLAFKSLTLGAYFYSFDLSN